MPLPPPPPPSRPAGSGTPGTPPLPNPPGAAPSTSTRAGYCYRHPERATGRRCTRCGRPACNECLRQAAVGSHCLECAKASKPALGQRVRWWSAGQASLVTTVLIGINVAVFVAVLIWTRTPDALAGSITTAHIDFALSKQALVVTHEWYRLLTSGFMHYGLIHIGLNMYFLYILGPMLEQPLGRVRYLLLYLASLFGGSFGVILLDSGGLTAGASGAVFGLMSAAAVGLWRRGVNPFSTGIGTTLLLNLFLTFFIGGISIGGHIGGAIAGALCALVMLAPSYRPMPNWATYAAPVAVAVVAIAGSVLLVNAA